MSENSNRPNNSILKYSGMAMQMAITIFAFGWIGNWIDGYLLSQKPIFTLIFLLVGTTGSVWGFLRKFMQ